MLEQQPMFDIEPVVVPEVVVTPVEEIKAPKTVTLNGREITVQPFFFYRHRELLS